MGFGAATVTTHQILEVVVVAGGVAVRVHGHETGVLQETGVDATTGAGIVVRHAVDHVGLEPGQAALDRQVVYGGGRLGGVDRATHHGHGGRGLLATRGHQGHGCHHRHGRLADADHVHFAVVFLQVADELLHVVDVVVEAESAFGQRYFTRIFPVGDVDLVVTQQGAHGIAQQRRVVAGQRGHHQHDRRAQQGFQCLGVVGIALETQQVAERLADFDAFVDSDADTIDRHRSDAELGLFVILCQTVQQVVAGCHAVGHGRVAHGSQRIGEQTRCHERELGKRFHQRALGFVNLVEHDDSLFLFAAVQQS